MTCSTADVIRKFTLWLGEAEAHPQITEPTAMCLATASGNQPSARIVLLKHVDENGFVFYTNVESRKGAELKENNHVALCFYWMPLARQIRVEGIADRVSDSEADTYFSKRPRESQLGAWASAQSRVLENAPLLAERTASMTKKYEGMEVPRPPFWGGWRISPAAIEFWQQGEHRLHRRELYTREGNNWNLQLLYP